MGENIQEKHRDNTVNDVNAHRSNYLLLVLRGLEFIVCQEIQEKLACSKVKILNPQATNKHLDTERGEAAVGKIWLETSATPNQVQSLCTVQCFLAYLGQHDSIDLEDIHVANAQIKKLLEHADWEHALELWRGHHDHYKDDDDNFSVMKKPVLFRASCIRDGNHKYKSVDLAAEMGGAILDRFPSWKVSLLNCQLDVVGILVQNHLVLGLSLVKRKFKNRLPGEDRLHMKSTQRISTLRPSTAHLMLRLGQPREGDFILDCMCGIGTIPLTATEYPFARTFALGGDIDADAINEMAAKNIPRGSLASLCHWDSCKLPLRSQCIDQIIIDMPFGMRCGTYRHISKIYPAILQELERVLRSDGKAVLLSMGRKLLMSSLERTNLIVETEFKVNVGGLGVVMVILRKASNKV